MISFLFIRSSPYISAYIFFQWKMHLLSSLARELHGFWVFILLFFNEWKIKFFDWIIFSSETPNNGFDSTKPTYFYLTNNSIIFLFVVEIEIAYEKPLETFFFFGCVQCLYSQVSDILYVLLDNSWKNNNFKIHSNVLELYSMQFMIHITYMSLDRMN